MSTQPEALRMAEQLDNAPYSSFCTNEAAAELRRLHEENTALRTAIEQAQKQEPVIDKAAAIRIATALGWTPPQQKQEPVAHWSDCAVHSEPAYPKGECDCGGFAASPQRQPLEGVIEIKTIGYHSLQLIFRSQADIDKFKAAHGIKGQA